jgi:hypothetical protein
VILLASQHWQHEPATTGAAAERRIKKANSEEAFRPLQEITQCGTNRPWLCGFLLLLLTASTTIIYLEINQTPRTTHHQETIKSSCKS